MKKLLAILLLCTGTAFAATTYSSEAKQAFYDTLVQGMMASMQDSLVKQGYPQANVQNYISKLTSRIDRTKLENSTWGCVTKYDENDMMNKKEEIAQKCFMTWTTELITQNADLMQYLKK